MNNSIQSRIEVAITKATGQEARFASSRTASGGCINDSRIVSLDDGRELFIKSHPQAASYPGMFTAEFESLSLLAAPRVIKVPQPIACDHDFIVMEMFKEGPRTSDWHERIGHQLAQLHLETQSDQFGFERDNYLGTTPQSNTWTSNWLDFWRDQRLGAQLETFARKTGSDDRILMLGDRLLARLGDYLGDIDEPAVLLHGDLWSGNASADENGEPIIYDPASYFGHREAEIGMMRMFGGFGPRCEAAYQEVWPLQEGCEERICLYQLYHELNHLNLFGNSYYQACVTTMEQLV